jgi:small subunit ribosomal protein S17
MVSDQKNSTLRKKILTGVVTSDKMQNTVVVEVERTFMHPFFNKAVRVRRKYKVHDEHSQAKVGDIVSFFEGRPVSKTKYMYLDSVVSKSATSNK